jgi:hypothetical protein
MPSLRIVVDVAAKENPMRLVTLLLLFVFTGVATSQQPTLAPESQMQHWPIKIQLDKPMMDSDTTATNTMRVDIVRDGERVSVAIEYAVAGRDRRWRSARESIVLSASEWQQLLPAIQKAVQ